MKNLSVQKGIKVIQEIFKTDKFISRYMEQTQEKMNDMNYKILEIRQLCGFSSKVRDGPQRGAPDGEETINNTEDAAKTIGKKWMQIAKNAKNNANTGGSATNHEK